MRPDLNRLLQDLDRLSLPSQQSQARGNGVPRQPPASTPRINGEFLKGPIPLSWLSVASSLPGKAPLAVALAIWFESGRRRSNQIILTSAILERFGVKRKSKYRGLRALEDANLISVHRKVKRNPVVTIVDPSERNEAVPSNDTGTRTDRG